MIVTARSWTAGLDPFQGASGEHSKERAWKTYVLRAGGLSNQNLSG